MAATVVRFEIRRKIPHFRALWVGADDELYGSRGRQLLRTYDWGQSFVEVGRIPARGLLDLGYATRPTQRLLRLGLHYMVVTRRGSFVLVGRKVIYRAGAGEKLEAVFQVPRGSRPLNLTIDHHDRIWFGEYFDNPERQSVSIYRSDDDGLSWHPCYTFAPGTIRHVHGIQYDPYRRGLWVMTGDTDDESLIAFTADGFETLDVLASGSQEARVVSGIPTPRGLLCGTDTPLRENHIFHLDFEKRRRRRLTSVQNSVFYAYHYQQGYVFATTAEPSVVNDARGAYLWFSADGESWHEVAGFRKDRWSMKYFQFGQLLFPAGSTDCEYLVVSPVATRTDDGSCLIGTIRDT